MKRLLLVICVMCVLVLPVFALEPISQEQLIDAIYDAATGLYFYDGNYYDSDGNPVEYPQTLPAVPENVNPDSKADEAPDVPDAPDVSDTAGEPLTEAGESYSGTDNSTVPAPDDATLIHQEEASGNTQVNVFAIQTDDETGGTWIQGGSGESLTEKLFGEYTPYNASGIASVDWAWIADIVLFAILVICFFKIVAGVMKRV